MSSPEPIRDELTGCLIWQGSVNSNGYATNWTREGPRQAHVLAYEAQHGPVTGKAPHVDHLCRNRLCVNPAHLEAVSFNENMKRRSWAYRCRIEKCPAGHSLFLHGRRTAQGGNVCKVCSEL